MSHRNKSKNGCSDSSRQVKVLRFQVVDGSPADSRLRADGIPMLKVMKNAVGLMQVQVPTARIVMKNRQNHGEGLKRSVSERGDWPSLLAKVAANIPWRFGVGVVELQPWDKVRA